MKNFRHKFLSRCREYRGEILIFAFGFIAMNLIFIPKAFRQSTTVDPEAAGQFGAFVGGYFGALFALIGILLLYATLRSQRRASTEESFENKYFELIKMHRDNVAEVDLRGAGGRKLFVLLMREFRCTLEIVRQITQTLGGHLSQAQLLHIAYYCLFFGVGPNSSRMLKISLSTFDDQLIAAVEGELNKPETKRRIRDARKFKYEPFEGHQSRLGHYYRHSYQMVRYVDKQEFGLDKKYEHVKTIRAQLSTHEQALLLLNSLTPIGEVWWREHLIVRYRLVKNIPRDFFDSATELDVSKLFKHGYFEWEEVHAQSGLPTGFK
jgi:putative phage abortive infection protein